MKKHITTGLFLLVSTSIMAAPLTPEQALLRAGNNNFTKTRSAKSPELQMTLAAKDGLNALYLFSYEENGGYLVLSADDAVTPVLGYSDFGNVDPDNLAPTFRWWLEEYAEQIAYIRENSLQPFEPATRSEESRPVIAPLLSTQWDQGMPYNNACPKVGRVVCPTGCAATSMAQVMKYYQYPETGSGSISYFPSYEVGRLSMDLSAQNFDWANMIDNYETTDYTEEQADAVAYLMKACGYAIEMVYSTGESGTYTYKQAYALVNNFNYDSSLEYQFRMNYSLDEWTDLIYENISKGHPVIYGGHGPFLGGHSFVCDGYAGNGYFHFNWGWSGLSDGYFLLDSLTPAYQGTGGNIGGFSFAQDAIVNVFPATEEYHLPSKASLVQAGSSKAKYDDDIFIVGLEGSTWYGLGWFNLNYDTYSYSIALKLEKEGESFEPIYINEESVADIKVRPNDGWHYSSTNVASSLFFDIHGFDIPLGTYKATVVNRVKEMPEYGWMDITVTNGYNNYFYFEKDENGITINNPEPANVVIEDFQVLSPYYYSKPVKAKVVITNPSDQQLSKSIGVSAFGFLGVGYGNVNLFTSDSFVYTLDPGETKEYIWDLTFKDNTNTNLTEPLTLKFYLLDYYDYETYPNDPIDVEFYPAPVVLEGVYNINIPGAKEVDGSWTVPYSSPLPVEVEIEVKEGVLDDALKLSLWSLGENEELVYSELFSDYTITYMGETLKATFDLFVPETDKDLKYILRLENINPTTGNYEVIATTPSFQFEDSLGIQSVYNNDGKEIGIQFDKLNNQLTIESDSGIASILISSVDGVSYSPQFTNRERRVSIDMSNIPEGIVIITAIDYNGNLKSLKIKH